MTHGLSERFEERAAAGAAEVQRRLEASPRTARTAVVLGRLLGLAFLVCFATGLYSHFLQSPLPWMRFPTRPADLYQVTQGVHVTTGIACVPLLLAKLWVVYPRLFAWPALRSVGHALERAAIAVLVAASIVEVTIGLLDTYQWYPWHFPFRTVHYGLAWVVVGALALHVAAKLPIIARHWRRGSVDEPIVGPDEREDHA
jgi:Na+/proline symporter